MAKDNSSETQKKKTFSIWSEVFRQQYSVDYEVLEKFIEKEIEVLSDVKIAEKISSSFLSNVLSFFAGTKKPCIFKVMASMNGKAVVLDCDVMFSCRNREEGIYITLTSPNFQEVFSVIQSLIP